MIVGGTIGVWGGRNRWNNRGPEDLPPYIHPHPPPPGKSSSLRQNSRQKGDPFTAVCCTATKGWHPLSFPTVRQQAPCLYGKALSVSQLQGKALSHNLYYVKWLSTGRTEIEQGHDMLAIRTSLSGIVVVCGGMVDKRIFLSGIYKPPPGLSILARHAYTYTHTRTRSTFAPCRTE